MSDTFDFEAFIAGTELAQVKTGFYRKDHRVRIAELTKEHDVLPAAAGDERESAQESPRKALAEQIAALRDEMDASRVELTIRALTPDEFRGLPETADGIYEQLEMQAVSPKLNRDQWRTLANRIGFAQFAQISKDASDLVLSKVAVPDFSRSVSATLSPPVSSEN
jgi:hypothetical protein